MLARQKDYFAVRYNKHKHVFRTNSHSSTFAHLNEHGHSFDTIDNTMQILYHHKKGAHLNTLEQFYIHAESATNNHLNDSHTIFPNQIFDTLLKSYQPKTWPQPPCRQYPRSSNTRHYIRIQNPAISRKISTYT